jgi:hypothetical protein
MAGRKSRNPEPSEQGLQALLAEFSQLRNEIVMRTQLQAGIFALNITAVASATSIVITTEGVDPALLLVNVFLSSLLGISWINHASSIERLALYIGVQLGPRIQYHSQEPLVLRWEGFYRALRAGRTEVLSGLVGDATAGKLQKTLLARFREPEVALVGFAAPALASALPAILAMVVGDSQLASDQPALSVFLVIVVVLFLLQFIRQLLFWRGETKAHANCIRYVASGHAAKGPGAEPTSTGPPDSSSPRTGHNDEA